MHSCIYKGRVAHVRHLPFTHSFSYSIFMLYLDLSELPSLFDDRWFWSVDKRNIATFRRSDYLGDPAVSLDTAVREKVRETQGTLPDGPIRMLTHLRYFGHCFNPVSFYYCFDRAGEKVETIVAEVTNTPWRESHAYVLGEEKDLRDKEEKHFQLSKDFHVSPFIDMNQDYDWLISEPGDTNHIRMLNTQNGKPFFEADLQLNREEISGLSLAKLLLLRPPMTMKVVSAIYWQALKLRLKGAHFYTHPDKNEPSSGGMEA